MRTNQNALFEVEYDDKHRFVFYPPDFGEVSKSMFIRSCKTESFHDFYSNRDINAESTLIIAT